MVIGAAAALQLSLIFRVATFLCALPIQSIIETMRPMPLEVLPGAPDYVAGVAIVRGAPLPVIAVSRLLGEQQTEPGRLVVVRAGNRRVGLAVDAVLGFRTLTAGTLAGLPPLLSDASRAAVAEIGTLDGELLVVLGAAGVISPELFASIDAAMAAP